MPISLNPGFVLVLAAILVLAAPRRFRAPTIGGAALLSLWLLLDRHFGAASVMAQMGLHVVLLSLDALNRIFGIGMLLALVMIAVYSSARRSRFEDGAILLLAGGAISALFVGDLVSFVAATEVAGFGAAGVVFASPLAGANRAGIRMLIWQGVEGLLFLVGVAFYISANGGDSSFTRLDVTRIGDALILAALLIRLGAPLAHVWLKDAVRHASVVGAPAISAFSSALALYALARLFPAEPLLIGVGLATMALGLVLTLAADDLRSAGATALVALNGMGAALIGVGSPLALTAAEGLAFTAILSLTAFQMALGCVFEVRQRAGVSDLPGLSRTAPLTTALMVFSGLSIGAMPGTAAYATLTVALEATAQWETRAVWIAATIMSAMLLTALGVRPALAALRGARRSKRPVLPFPMLLGAGVSAFFCASVGMAPNWLYGLMPSELSFQPFALDQLAPQLELLGAASAIYALLLALGATPKERAGHIADVDSLYRGPVADGARWAGIILLRMFGALQSALQTGGAATGAWLREQAQAFDKPYAARFADILQLLTVALLTLVAILSVSS